MRPRGPPGEFCIDKKSTYNIRLVTINNSVRQKACECLTQIPCNSELIYHLSAHYFHNALSINSQALNLTHPHCEHPAKSLAAVPMKVNSRPVLADMNSLGEKGMHRTWIWHFLPLTSRPDYISCLRENTNKNIQKQSQSDTFVCNHGRHLMKYLKLSQTNFICTQNSA